MTSSEIKKILKSYAVFQMQTMVFAKNEDGISEESKDKARKFLLVKQCLEILPLDEKNLVTAIYVNRKPIARIAREWSFVRSTIYYRLEKAVERMAESIPLG